MADLSLSNVVAGLIGGAGASILTFAGALYLQTRAERRLRRARLLALETELRWNRRAVEVFIRHNRTMGDLTDLCWRDNYVALAADLPKDVYSDLRALYYMFATSSEYFELAKRAKATKKQLHWLQDWSGHALESQVSVTGELHVTWKLRLRVERLVGCITRFIRGSQKEPVEKDEE